MSPPPPPSSVPPADPVVSFRMEQRTQIAVVRGEIDLHNSPKLRIRLLHLLDENNPTKLVLNLADVPYMDSSGVAVLVEMLRRLRKTQGSVVLAGLQPRVRGILEIAQLTSVFPIVPDEAAALLGGNTTTGEPTR
jgi:anti-sigma B factor antagonist